jgi:hypothetical protein
MQQAEVTLPSGTVHVSGVLQPSEDSDLMAIPSDVDRLTTSALVAALESTVHDGYLVAVPPLDGFNQVTPRLSGTVSVPLHWRNIVYVGNWLTFAVITLAMWTRVVRDEVSALKVPEAE